MDSILHQDKENFKVVCEICGKKIKNNNKHIINIHGVMKPRNLRCDICNKTFIQAGTLKTHIRTIHEACQKNLNVTVVANHFL